MATELEHSFMEGDRLKVFAANARCLSQEEVSGLPLDVRSSAEATGMHGTWLEVACPDQACIIGKDKITLSVKGVGEREEEGRWVRLFCPDKACVITSPTDLP